MTKDSAILIKTNQMLLPHVKQAWITNRQNTDEWFVDVANKDGTFSIVDK